MGKKANTYGVTKDTSDPNRFTTRNYYHNYMRPLLQFNNYMFMSPIPAYGPYGFFNSGQSGFAYSFFLYGAYSQAINNPFILYSIQNNQLIYGGNSIITYYHHGDVMTFNLARSVKIIDNYWMYLIISHRTLDGMDENGFQPYEVSLMVMQ